MATEFSTGKSVFVLAIVAGCFAILWPNIFYPMLQGTYTPKNTLSIAQGDCCDVIFDNDVEAIKVMIDLCEKILNRNHLMDRHAQYFTVNNIGNKLTAEMVEQCRNKIWEKCHLDITQILSSKSGLNRSYRQFLEELRSSNGSVCLKNYFGVSFGLIGLPRNIRIWGLNRSKHLRQERPPHLRPEFLHPALREKGRAIPHSHIVPKVDGRTGPMPGTRPPMGGAGHVVPPPKGSGTMGIVMPMYTIGIVVFFLYTMMKLMFKKSDTGGSYDSFTSDPDFHRAVFGDYNNYTGNEQIASDDSTKLVVSAITGLVEEVNKQIRSDESVATSLQETEDEDIKEIGNTAEEIIEECKVEVSDRNIRSREQAKGSVVKVVGYETTESCVVGGKKYSRPPTPNSRPSTPASRPISPQSLYLPNLLPPQSQLLVSQEETHSVPSEDSEEPMVLSAKVTLSLIGLPEKETYGSEQTVSDEQLLTKPKFDMKNKEKYKNNEKEANNKLDNEMDDNSNLEEFEIARESPVDRCTPTAQLNTHLRLNSSKI